VYVNGPGVHFPGASHVLPIIILNKANRISNYDFNANLDKTLSEIRAALDEVFSSFSEEKETYYPPRAQGEGSRSKQHSYAIPSIKQEDITIIGN